jgi:hypothetical protein
MFFFTGESPSRDPSDARLKEPLCVPAYKDGLFAAALARFFGALSTAILKSGKAGEPTPEAAMV